jgi:DNA-binding transcriptional LysR family regulator
LPPVLARFRKSHPRIGVTLEVSDSRRALVELLEQNCDLALIGATTVDRRVAYLPIADDEVVLVGPQPNPFAPSGRLGHAALARVPLIVREDGSGTRKPPNAALQKAWGSRSCRGARSSRSSPSAG